MGWQHVLWRKRRGLGEGRLREPLLSEVSTVYDVCPDGSSRIVVLNEPHLNREQRFPSNYVSTTKYTLINFLPKNLLEQFMRAANFYFLCTAILTSIPEISPVAPYSSYVPLVFVLSVTAIKEAIEDWRRFTSDRLVNNSATRVVRPHGYTSTAWRDVVVGDFVVVEEGHALPADLILLSSSDEYGMCYIETSNLDGETNLKIRQALSETSALIRDPLDALELKGVAECDLSNSHLYTFDGALRLQGRKPLPLGVNQLLLRGATLRNTEWVCGLTIYAGHETKVMMNSTDPPHKRSQVERIMNKELYRIFAVEGILCIFAAIMQSLWVAGHKDASWYLVIHFEDVATVGFKSFWTYIILLNIMVPISLYVTLELVKVVQAFLINQDLAMYYEKTNTPARARTSNLNEELGQVQYVFSDKTGTITCNQMCFVKCSVGGVMYGNDESTKREDVRRGSSHLHTSDKDPPGNGVRPKFHDPRLLEGLCGKDAQTSALIHEFLCLLATCHTIVPEKDKNDPERIIYQSSSPDETALVEAAKDLGYVFTSRTPQALRIYTGNERISYDVLNVLEFTSERRRMSVILRHPNGKIKLYCKGADTVVLPRIRAEDSALMGIVEQHLHEFGGEGLRTLCMAFTELDEAHWQEWNSRCESVATTLVDRDRKLAELFEEVERDLTLLGATAIEDQLQEGVPETISNLREAGIKVWLLTGDKQETAINIGFSSHLLEENTRVLVINENNKLDTMKQLLRCKEEIDDQVYNESGDAVSIVLPSRRVQFVALVMDGHTLQYALEEEVKDYLFTLAEKCHTVICCRVSPLQKARVVEMVKTAVSCVTLAIGDGANDVSMIQEAHIGVGVSGEEGMQAVLASDFSIAQFRFLSRLLLVHGHQSFKRVTKLILYFFYKNFTAAFMQFWFSYFTHYSGQTLFTGLMSNTYNLIFTALPVFVMGIFDQVVSARGLEHHPGLYLSHRADHLFSDKVFWSWVALGTYQSVVAFFTVRAITSDTMYNTGETTGIWMMGTLCYILVVLIVTLQIGLMISFWTILHHIAVWGSIAVLFIFFFVYCGNPSWNFGDVHEFSDMYGVIYEAMNSARFYLVLVLVPIVAILPSYAIKYVRRNYFPDPYYIVQEMELLQIRIPREMTSRGRLDFLKRPLKYAGRAATIIQRAFSRKYTGFAFSLEPIAFRVPLFSRFRFPSSSRLHSSSVPIQASRPTDTTLE